MPIQPSLPWTRLLPVAFAALAIATESSTTEVCKGQIVAAEQVAPRASDRLMTTQDHMRAFDQEIRAFAKLLDLPGMVVVVARDGMITHQVDWGHADIDSKTPVNVNHLFWLASVTKTFTATLIMQMVDEGLVNLDDRMIDYWFPSFFPVRITPDYRLRHVLGHTAQGTPGRTFVYSGGRYGFVYGVFEKVGGLTLKERLIRRILTPLKMESTMPGIGDERSKHLRDKLVTPYRYDPVQHRHVKDAGILGMGELYASSGMASSAIDLVRFAHALETDEILSAGSHAAMTRPAVSTDGYALPYGVGWFVQKYGDEQLIWHYGYGGADSALLVRVPQRRLTLVALANSDQMSACSLLGDGDLLTSPVAVSFVKHFVSPERASFASPEFDVATASVERHLDALHQAGAAPIYEDEVFAQALARDYLRRRDGRKESKAPDLLRWLLRKSPKRLTRADIAMLTLLSRQSDPELLGAVKPVLNSLLTQQPENPGVLTAAVQYHEGLGHELAAIDARRQLANLKGYEDDSRKQEAALRLGKYFSSINPDLACTYFWNARTWWFNSGSGGELDREVTRSLDEIRLRRKDAPKLIARATIGQEVDSALGAPERAAVIDGVVEKILKIYVYPDVAKQMAQAIRDRQAKKEYDAISSGQELAKVLTRHLREVCKDNHLDVEFFAKGIPYDSEKKPDPKDVERFRQGGMRRNYEFKKVERLEGGIGLLQVDGFYPAEWITETATGAMAFLANSESIILDLRQNSGGQSGGGLLCSYFFKEETHLTDFYNRPENTTRQIWSYPVAGAERFADKDLYILISHRTFSAGEALAYDMQALKRATIVGEPTPGGAHGTTIYRITDHFSASIPFCRSINPVTKTDWEGTGVKPDVAVPANQALLTAHLLALKKALTKYADKPDVADSLKRVIAGKEKELDALKTK